MKKKESIQKIKKDFGKDMSISSRLSLSYKLMMGLMLLVAILAIFGIRTLNTNMAALVSGAEQANDAIKTCRIETNTAARNVREMALNTDGSSSAEYKENFEKNLNDTDVQLKALKETGVVSDDMYQSYVDSLTSWANDAYEIVNLLEAGDRETATSMIFTNCVPALNDMVTIAEAIDEEIDATIDSSIVTCKRLYYVCVAIVVIVTLITLVFSVRVSNDIQKAITVPLAQIEECAHELTKGNLHTNLECDSNDELGKLANDLRTAVDILSSYVEDISVTMGEFAKGNFDVQPTVEWRGDFVGILDAFNMFENNMADTVNGIRKVASEVEMDAEQVSATSMELAQGATDQASVMEEFTATIETVSDQVSANAEYTREISKQVEDIGGKITITTDKMNDMVESMNEIEKSSQEIRQIIDTISDVASQTNLLALNASIEAARAGESGRGFAVVADQVTALAASTASAVKDSTKLIENSIAEVSKGMQITEEISKQQSTVAENARSIVEEVNNVADTLSAQKESFLQLNEGVNQINYVVQTNSATSQQCAASSQEMNGQADALSKLIARFKVAEA
jgi:methyl-accepting chemotaxis protein